MKAALSAISQRLCRFSLLCDNLCKRFWNHRHILRYRSLSAHFSPEASSIFVTCLWQHFPFYRSCCTPCPLLSASFPIGWQPTSQVHSARYWTAAAIKYRPAVFLFRGLLQCHWTIYPPLTLLWWLQGLSNPECPLPRFAVSALRGWCCRKIPWCQHLQHNADSVIESFYSIVRLHSVQTCTVETHCSAHEILLHR